MINELAKTGDLRTAVELFDGMSYKGVCPDVVCYNILIDGYFRNGNVAGVYEIWEDCLQLQTFVPMLSAIML